MADFFYELLNKMPDDIPTQMPLLPCAPDEGFNKTERWKYTEARILNQQVLADYKILDSMERFCCGLTFDNRSVKTLFKRKKQEFAQRMNGMLYVTNQRLFFNGKRYQMSRFHNKITEIAEKGNMLRVVYGKQEEWFFVHDKRLVLQNLMLHVDKSCLLRHCFYYNFLLSNGQEAETELYERIYFSLSQRKDFVLVDKCENGRAVCHRIMLMVLLDHPMLYFVNIDKTGYFYEEQVIRMKLRYVYESEKYKELDAAVYREVFQLVDEAKKNCGSDTMQQIKWLYHYLVTHLFYAEKDLKSKDEIVQCRIHSVLGVFLDGRAVCDGIARAFKLFLDELGVENLVVRQDLEENAEYCHEWNMVLLEDEFFHIDLTWELNWYSKTKQMTYEFFLLTDEEMKEKHHGKEGNKHE